MPCCGFSFIPSDTDDTVEVIGCPNGIDWTILHENGHIKLITYEGIEVCIEPEEYRKIVFDFADKIKAFYKSCKEKILPEDEYDREGYEKFWIEWKKRRGF